MNIDQSNNPLERFGIWPFVLPFLIFMVLTMFEPKFPSESRDMLGTVQESEQTTVDEETAEFINERRAKLARRFVIGYAIKIAVVGGMLLFFARLYLQHFRFSCSWLAVVVGAVGVVIWVGLCHLELEKVLIDLILGEAYSARSQFNPFAQLEAGWQQVSFIAVRFLGLVLIVPVCEELFLRGFLMRFVESPSWSTVSLARLSLRTMLVAPIYGLATHPTEAVAAIVWFSMVTWLVSRTGKFWDAVLAHAVTNLLLGLYVCLYSQWQLW